MESIIELLVSGNTSSGVTYGQVDLYDNEPMSIKYQISDIKNFTERKGTFSQGFTVPGNPNNNRLFSNIFEIGIDSYFDPRKKAAATIIVDNILIAKGYIQLNDISIEDKDAVKYQIVFYGETNDLISKLEGLYLTDLDFSELNHALSIQNVTGSWSGNSDLGYYYPLIDYSYDFDITTLSTTGVTLQQLFPATYTKYILDKIFSAAGFTYTSTFLNSSAFTETIIPYNGNSSYTLPASLSTAYTFSVGNGYNFAQPFSAYTNWNNPTNPGNIMNLEIGAAFAGVNKTTGGYFDNGNGIVDIGFGVNGYSAQTISAQRFTANLGYELFASGNTQAPAQFPYQRTPTAIGFKWYRSTYGGFSVPFHVDTPAPNPPWIPGSPFYYNKITNVKSVTPWLDNPLSTNYYPVQEDEIIVPIAYVLDSQWGPVLGPPSFSGHVIPVRIYSANTYFSNEFSLTRVSGMTITYNDYIPQKIKQTEFLNSIINMFNLYIEPDKDNINNLIIEPRDTFYSGGTIITDWVLDQEQPVTEKLISEQQDKKTTFTYKKDKDYLNTKYEESRNRVYGDFIFDIDNDFINSERKIEVIFSPSPMSNVIGTTDFIIPQIYKLDNAGVYGATESNIRFLRKNPTLTKITDGSTWNIAGSSFTGLTAYPYAGHVSHPFTGETDYNWSDVPYVYYNHTATPLTANNLKNVYWGQYLQQIADKDSKLITCSVFLKPLQIKQFSFRNLVFLEGLTDDGGAYFIVQSINYDPTIRGSYQVELLKVKNVAQTFIPTFLESTDLGPSSTARSGLSLGGGRASLPGSISLGLGNYSSSRNSVSIGDNSIIMPGSDNSSILGSNSLIDSSSRNSTIVGDNSRIEAISPGSSIFGNNSSVLSGVTGTTIFGDNISATTSDTTYMNNIYVYSAITLPGGVIYSAGTSPNFCSAGLKTSAISGCSAGPMIDFNTFPTGMVLSDDNSSLALEFVLMLPGSGLYLNSPTALSLSSAVNVTMNGGSFVQTLSGNTYELYNTVSLNGSSYFYMPDNSSSATSRPDPIQAFTIGSQNSTINTGLTNTVILGGQNITASLSDTVYVPDVKTSGSFGGGNSSVPSTTTSISYGTGCIVNGNYAQAFGFGAWASGDTSFAQGNSSVAQAPGSIAMGVNCNAYGQYSFAQGVSTITSGYSSYAGGYSSQSNNFCEWSRSSVSTGQFGIVSYAIQTTNATITEMFLDGSTASERFKIQSGEMYGVKIMLVGKKTSTGDSVYLTGEGLIKNVGGTVSLVGTFPMTIINNDAALSTVSSTVTADNTNKSLKVEVTGVAATTIEWFAKAEYVSLN